MGESSGNRKYSTLLVFQLLSWRLLLLYVFVFVFLCRFWIAIDMSFQKMYGFEGLGLSEMQLSISELSVVGNRTEKIDKKIGFTFCFVKLHCNYNGEIGWKWDMVMTFDRGSYWCEYELHFARPFQGYPIQPYFAYPNMCPKYHIWHIWRNWCTYKGALNMVEWGIPEKILRDAIQTRWPCVNRTPQSKVVTKSHFCLISPL